MLRLLEEFYSNGKMVTARVTVINLNETGSSLFSDVNSGFHTVQNEVMLKATLDLLENNKDLLIDKLKKLETDNPNVQLLKNILLQRNIEYFAGFIQAKQRSLIHREIERKYNWKTWIFTKDEGCLSWVDLDKVLSAIKIALKENRDVLINVKVNLDTGESETDIY